MSAELSYEENKFQEMIDDLEQQADIRIHKFIRKDIYPAFVTMLLDGFMQEVEGIEDMMEIIDLDEIHLAALSRDESWINRAHQEFLENGY